jgi:hypothetical protein
MPRACRNALASEVEHGGRGMRALHVLGSALLGLGLCVGALLAANALGIDPRAPAFGGEDDFALLAAIFFFGVCPAFVALGAWIGIAARGNGKDFAARWLGVIAGTLVSFAALALLAPSATIATRIGANRSIAGFFVSWVIVATVAAYLSGRAARTP